MFLFLTITLLNSLTDQSGQSLFNKQDNKLLFKGEVLYKYDNNHDISMMKIGGHKEYRDIVDITNLENIISDSTNTYRIEFYIESNANADPLFSNSLSRKSKTVFVEFNTIDSFYKNLNRFLTMTYGTQLLTLVGELDGDIEDGKSTVTSAHKGDENNYLIASNCYIRVMKAEVQQENNLGKFYSIGDLDIYHGSEGVGTLEDIMKNYILPTGYNNRFCTITTKDLPINGELYDLFIIHYKVNRGNLGVHAVGQQIISETTHCFFIKQSESEEFEDTIEEFIEENAQKEEQEEQKGITVKALRYDSDNDEFVETTYTLGDKIPIGSSASTNLLVLTEELMNKLTIVSYTDDITTSIVEKPSYQWSSMFLEITEQVATSYGLDNSLIGNYLFTAIYLLADVLSKGTVNSAYYIYDGVEYEVTLLTPNYSQNYLTFTALEDSTFTFTQNALQYSLDDGATWFTLDEYTNTPTITAGNKIMWKGIPDLIGVESGIGAFSATGNFEVSGNIMSLLYGDNFIGQTDLTGKNWVFSDLFVDNSKLINAENLILPATTLEERCYSGMFGSCTSLRTAPELHATVLANGCYYSMFYNCISLTTAPELPATTLASECYSSMFQNCTSLIVTPELSTTTLADSCYDSMFYGCTSLTTAPVLPAAVLANGCYSFMFCNCTSLTTAPELLAITLADWCYYQMFSGCTSLNYIKCLATDISANNCTINWVSNVAATGTFVEDASMTSWTTGTSGIPSGWNVINKPPTDITDDGIE